MQKAKGDEKNTRDTIKEEGGSSGGETKKSGHTSGYQTSTRTPFVGSAERSLTGHSCVRTKVSKTKQRGGRQDWESRNKNLKPGKVHLDEVPEFRSTLKPRLRRG